MNREEIINALRMLARSQGFYGRLLVSLQEASEEDRNEFLLTLENCNFKDDVDLVMYLETEHEEIYH